MTVYKWKSGVHAKCSAQVAGEECRRLEIDGDISPARLVDASRPVDAPLHGEFEWDDSVAAEKYREDQARYIIRSLEVEISESPEPVRAYFSIASEDTRTYTNIRQVLCIKSSRETMIEQALRELKAFERKYSQLEELAEVFAAIRAVA